MRAEARIRVRPLIEWSRYLILFAGVIIVLAPLYWTFITSIKIPEETVAYPIIWIPSKVTLAHFRTVWHAQFATYYRNSIIVAVPVVLGILLTSSMAGFIFAKFEFPGRDLLFLATLSTMMVPFAVILIPVYLIIVKLKWMNTFLALIVPNLVSSFGIFLMRQFIANIPDALIDAARIDGSSYFGIFWRIILPLCKPALAALAVFHFIWIWNSFLWPLIVTTSDATRTLPVGLVLFIHKYWFQYNRIIAGSVLIIAPLIIFYLIFQRTFIQGITLTGLKY